MLRHRKGPGVVARKRIPSMLRPHYLMAYLWESAEAMEVGASARGAGVQESPEIVKRHGTGIAIGLCAPAAYSETDNADGSVTVHSRPLIAEVHFVKGRWTEEIVAHELMHAALHRMRLLPPFHHAVLDQEGAAEETVCREFGRWMDGVWRWLWEVDAYGKHATTTTSTP
jgi:hypothetical protein